MKKLFLFLGGIIFLTHAAFAQTTEKKSPRMDFTYLKRTSGDRMLKANVYLFENRQQIPLKGIPVKMTIAGDTSELTILTDNQGNAILLIDAKTKIPADKEGNTGYSASFAGNDSLESAEGEISVKDATLSMSLEMIDSVKTVRARLTTWNDKGDTLGVSGETVNFYIPRMFSLLKIGEETTDDEGYASIAFPGDLPGEHDGSIGIVIKVEDSENYANLEVRKTSGWGTPVIHRIPASHRELWTEIAPVWMIITLTILLCGVWGHYIFVIIQLILVKKANKKTKA